MKLSQFIENLKETLEQEGDYEVLLDSSEHPIGVYMWEAGFEAGAANPQYTIKLKEDLEW